MVRAPASWAALVSLFLSIQHSHGLQIPSLPHDLGWSFTPKTRIISRFGSESHRQRPWLLVSRPRQQTQQQPCRSMYGVEQTSHHQSHAGESGEADHAWYSSSRDMSRGRPTRKRGFVKRWAVALTVSLLLVLPVFGRAAAKASTTANVLSSDPLVSATMQLDLAIRLLVAALVGAAIGGERSGLKYHPAGIRTMSLVSLGAALFTVCSRHGFVGTHYDTSRMASNVASGVGFIGAGVIYHEHRSDVVHGVTTAAAIWISAAVGVACGTGLYIVASTATGIALGILRIGGVVKHRRRRKRRKRKLTQAPSSSSLQNQFQEQETIKQPVVAKLKKDQPPDTVVTAADIGLSERQPPIVWDEDDESLIQSAFQNVVDEQQQILPEHQQPPFDWLNLGEDEEARELFMKNLKLMQKWKSSNQTRDGGPAP